MKLDWFSIFFVILAFILITMFFYPAIDAQIKYKYAKSNCRSNGWDTAGYSGLFINKQFECYNYTKAERDVHINNDNP